MKVLSRQRVESGGHGRQRKCKRVTDAARGGGRYGQARVGRESRWALSESQQPVTAHRWTRDKVRSLQAPQVVCTLACCGPRDRAYDVTPSVGLSRGALIGRGRAHRLHQACGSSTPSRSARGQTNLEIFILYDEDFCRLVNARIFVYYYQ